MDIAPTKLPEVLLITPAYHGDSRGWFAETYNAQALASAGITADFVQDNHSFSAQPATVRGLHFQTPPHAQDKLIRVIRGRVMDVAVDIRAGSPRYGQWVAVELSAQNRAQLFVPQGFAHGFATLAPDTEVLYKCSDFYAPECEGSLRFDDATLAINWGINGAANLSDKDKTAPAFADFTSPFKYERDDK